MFVCAAQLYPFEIVISELFKYAKDGNANGKRLNSTER